MTLYRYTSISSDGARRSGKLEAGDETLARQMVASYGDVLIELRASAERSWFRLERNKELSLQQVSSLAPSYLT